MAFFKIEYKSHVLGMERQVNVIYPDAEKDSTVEDTDIPVLYLLHGMGGNENSWQKRTNIERLLRHTKLIVVMPSTDLAWYTNTSYQMAYYDAIADELPKVMQRFFPHMSRKRSKTFIAGLSMGGYGAYKIALLTNRFSHAASLSGALLTDSDNSQLWEVTETQKPYWEGVFGDLDTVAVSEHYLTHMATLSDKQTQFYAWCGYEDFLYETNQTAIQRLRDLGLTITYEKDHGKHEWYYWNKQLERVLEWLPIDYVKEERLS